MIKIFPEGETCEDDSNKFVFTMNFKTFLPVEDYTLITKLSVDETRSRIQYNTGTKVDTGSFAPNSNSSKPYEGLITGNSFKITRILNYRNSFSPIITGTISNYMGRTEVKISMQLSFFVKKFILLFFLFIGIALIIQLSLFLGNMQSKSSFTLLITFVSFIFLVFLTYFAFKKESSISKQHLAGLLEAE